MKLHLLSCFLLGGVYAYLININISTCTATDNITPNKFLKDGDLLVSTSGFFALGFFNLGTSPSRYVGIWYNKIPEQTVVWVANNNNPITSTSGNATGGMLSIDLHSGNLVLHDNVTKLSYWSTNVSIPSPILPSNSSSVQLLDNGNLVLFQDETKTTIAWQGFDYPSNTFLPQMKIGIDLKSGFNRFITSWRSNTDPANGDYHMKMELAAGAPQIFVYKGSIKFWRTGSWNGIRLVGIPDMAANTIFDFNYVENDEEASFAYTIHDPSIFSRFVVIESGTTNLLTWQGDVHQWVISRFSPKDLCDYYNHCGPFSECNPFNFGQFECNCLPGYEPKVPNEWSRRDAIGGCIRMQGQQLCNKGEGFVKLVTVKIPDLLNARVSRSLALNLKGCEELCRNNCSCTGYANANISNGGSGCITWHGDLIDIRQYSSLGGQDFYIRVSAAVLEKFSKKSKKPKILVVSLTVSISGLLVLLLLGLWLVLTYRKSKLGLWLVLKKIQSFIILIVYLIYIVYC